MLWESREDIQFFSILVSSVIMVSIITSVYSFLTKNLWHSIYGYFYPNYKWEKYTISESYPTDHNIGKAKGNEAPYEEVPLVSKEESKFLMEQFDHPKYLHKYAALQHHTKGPIFRDYLGTDTPVLFIADPRCVSTICKATSSSPGHVVPEAWRLYLEETDRKRGLFFMEGEEWSEYRKILDKRLLNQSVLKPHFPVMAKSTHELMEQFYLCHVGKTFESVLLLNLYKWSLEVMSHIVMGRGFDQLRGSKNGEVAFSELVGAIHGIFEDTVAMGSSPHEEEMRNNTPNWVGFTENCDKALNILTDFTETAIEECLKDTTTSSACVLETMLKEDKLPKDIVVRLVVDLFLAAADTTAWTATWVLFALSKEPIWVSTAKEEVQQVLEKKGADLMSLELEDLKDLVHCRNILRETLRMYPTAPFLTRKIDKPCTIANYQIPPKTMAIVSLYSIGHDPLFFPNPEAFLPQRWNPKSKAFASLNSASSPDISKMTALPWGMHPRSCVGRSMAESLLVVFVAHMASAYTFENYNCNLHLKMEMISVTSEQLELNLVKNSL